MSSWDDLVAKTLSQRRDYLALEEAKEPLYTVPAGFRSVGKELNIKHTVGRELKHQPCVSSVFIV